MVIFGLGELTVENYARLKFVGPVTGIFFLLASIPTFLWVREPKGERHSMTAAGLIAEGFARLRQTIREAGDFRDLIILLVSFFFAYAGLSIVISFAFIYGDQIIRWDAGTQVLMFILTQLTAAAGALFFGIIQDRIGARVTYTMTLVLWVVAVTLIFGASELTGLLNSLTGASMQVQNVFLLIGCLAGLGLGATQSACRAMTGIFSPESRSGEFFGLWSMTARLSSIAGLLGLGFLQTVFGLRKAILLCSMFFFIAIIVTLFINEKRGRAAAAGHQGF
jgi:UMF1 family MFS transporter